MNKAQEISLLDKTIKALGPDSYLGPWLSNVRHEVAWLISTDVIPAITLADAIAAGKAKAEEIVAAERAAIAKEREELEKEKAALAKKREALEVEKGKIGSMLQHYAERIWEI